MEPIKDRVASKLLVAFRKHCGLSGYVYDDNREADTIAMASALKELAAQSLKIVDAAVWDKMVEASKGIKRLYESDKGCRTLPEYIALKEALAAARDAKVTL